MHKSKRLIVDVRTNMNGFATTSHRLPDMCDNSASRAGSNPVEALGTIKHQKHLPNVTKAFLLRAYEIRPHLRGGKRGRLTSLPTSNHNQGCTLWLIIIPT